MIKTYTLSRQKLKDRLSPKDMAVTTEGPAPGCREIVGLLGVIRKLLEK